MIGKVIAALLTPLGKTYPMRAKQGQAAPYMVYTVISDRPTDTKEGPSELDVKRVQIDTYAATYAECMTLMASVRSTIDRYRGTVQSVVVDKIVFENEQDFYDNEAELYRRSQDYFIRIKL